jgi:hypothetical protein
LQLERASIRCTYVRMYVVRRTWRPAGNRGNFAKLFLSQRDLEHNCVSGDVINRLRLLICFFVQSSTLHLAANAAVQVRQGKGWENKEMVASHTCINRNDTLQNFVIGAISICYCSLNSKQHLSSHYNIMPSQYFYTGYTTSTTGSLLLNPLHGDSTHSSQLYG